jgi:hypothetical protein
MPASLNRVGSEESKKTLEGERVLGAQEARGAGIPRHLQHGSPASSSRPSSTQLGAEANKRLQQTQVREALQACVLALQVMIPCH